LSLLKKFLGLGDSKASGGEGDTATVRRIASELERLPPAKAKYLAAFAYVLARVAHADLEIDDDETREMQCIATRLADLSDAEAALVVEIAKNQARLLGETENYVVTREFRNIATAAQRGQLLQCLFAVAAADGTISSVESAELAAIGEELGFTRPEIMGTRAAWKKVLAEFQNR
jgi:uncharacterized tellurite resistance protein B-like protein